MTGSLRCPTSFGKAAQRPHGIKALIVSPTNASTGTPSMTFEHPVNEPIRRIDITAFEQVQNEMYEVGVNDVTRIEATTKSGMYADIPYLRVWKGETVIAEFCQHNIVGVYYGQPRDENTPF